MTVESTLVAMMNNLDEPSEATESEWNRFATRAHRSLWGRRAGIFGVAGIGALAGTTVLDANRSPRTGAIPPAAGYSTAPTSLVEVWFVKDGELYRTQQDSAAGVTESEETGGAVDLIAQTEDALQRLLAGVPDDAGPGVTSAIPIGTELLSFEIEANVARVDLSEEMRAAEFPQVATGQVVYTASQVAGIENVRVTVEGRPMGDAPAQRREHFEDALPRILLLLDGYSDDGAHLADHISGSVQMGKGRLFFELRDENGKVIAKGPIHTRSCPDTSCRRPFREEIDYNVDYEQIGELTISIRQVKTGITHEVTDTVRLVPRP